jgi:translation initiation factor 2B subunit (eIF-2B alpha/beta/delta family)
MKKGRSRFEKIIEDIKSIKVQGAENVARAGIKAYLLQPNKKSAKKILTTRPTEPLLKNALRFLQKSKNPNTSAKKFLSDLKKDHDKITKKGAMMIKNDMNIYTHCHSSTVMDILKYAKRKRKKNFVVYTTEVEPLRQGHITAKDLAKAKIKVVVSPDLAAEQTLRKCDIFFFGADAFTKNFVVNKIGTSTLCKLAKDYRILTYSCGVSKKFTKQIKIETRPGKEVWDERNKHIEPFYPAFDKTNQKLVTGIISEFGVMNYKEFVKKALSNLKRLS